MHQAMQFALANCGLEPEKRPFKPHVTLARKSVHPAPEPLAEPVVWLADRISLIRSDTHGAVSAYSEIWHRQLDAE